RAATTDRFDCEFRLDAREHRSASPESDRSKHTMTELEKRNFVASVTTLSLALLLAACSKPGEGTEAEKSKSEESRVKHGTSGETIVVLDAETQQRVGIKVANPAPTRWQPEVTGYGRVLDPATLASLTTDLVQAHVALETSQHEFERLKTLAEQKN